MTRLLLALLAMLTGLATCGSPAIASVQAQSPATAIAATDEQAQLRVSVVARTLALSPMPPSSLDVSTTGIPFGRHASAPSIRLRVDRAHE